MNDEIKNINFLKDAISNFKGEINQFVSNPDLGIVVSIIIAINNAIRIRHSLDNLQNKIVEKEKNLANKVKVFLICSCFPILKIFMGLFFSSQLIPAQISQITISLIKFHLMIPKDQILELIKFTQRLWNFFTKQQISISLRKRELLNKKCLSKKKIFKKEKEAVILKKTMKK